MYEIEFYESEEDGKWRWRAKAANGEIVADGGQGYADEDNARDGFNGFVKAIRLNTYDVKVTRRG